MAEVLLLTSSLALFLSVIAYRRAGDKSDVTRPAEKLVGAHQRRLEARTRFLRVRERLLHAHSLAHKSELGVAEAQLEEAIPSLGVARKLLEHDETLGSEVEAVARSLDEAIAAVRKEAEDMRPRIAKLVHDVSSLVATLEASESRAREPGSGESSDRHDEDRAVVSMSSHRRTDVR